MLRPALLAALCGLALAAPAASAALAPAPTVLDFEALPLGAPDAAVYAGAGVTLRAPLLGEGSTFCGGFGRALAAAAPLECASVATPGHDSERSLRVDGALLDITFATPQAGVSLWVTSSTDVTVEAWSGQPGSSTLIDRPRPLSNSSRYGRAGVVRSALGRADIVTVRVQTDDTTFSVDDITFSPVAQPDTQILSGPAPVTRSTDASFVFLGNQADTRFDCALDDAAAVPCRPPSTLTGLAAGPHTLTVAMVDRFGSPDQTPAVWAWTVDLAPVVVPAPTATPAPTVAPPAPPADADGDGVADARDNCAAAANATQADGDGDGVGDACEVAGPGTLAPITGERVLVKVLSGEVFVKLAAPARALKQALPGFVPLKGQAALPVGTVIDTRKGRLAMTSTVDGRRLGAGGATQTATLAAGIFQIRQRRAAPGSRARVSTDLALQSAPGAEASCVSTGTSGPIKGRGRNTVRGLSATTAKGLYRIIGAAGISTATDATWATQDRCDGTRTDVGKGTVSVLDRTTGKATAVPAGRSYLVKAKLFRARQVRG